MSGSYCPVCQKDTGVDAEDWFRDHGHKEFAVCQNCGTKLSAYYDEEGEGGFWALEPVEEETIQQVGNANADAEEKKRYLHSLPISVRARNVLENANCWSEMEIVNRFSRATLMREPNCGEKTAAEIANFLASRGVTLLDEETHASALDGLRREQTELTRRLAEVESEIAGLKQQASPFSKST